MSDDFPLWQRVTSYLLGPIGGFVLLGLAASAEEVEVKKPPEPRITIYHTATVRARSVASTTAAVTVIDRQMIEESGATNVAEILAFVPGVSLTTNAPRGGLTTAQIRGGDPNFTLVLLDGVPMNDGTYQVGEVFNFESLAAAAIERVEIVRGPLSAFYGSTGLAGAIQIITRQGTGGSTRAEAGLGVGDGSYGHLRGAIAGGTRQFDYFLDSSWETEKGRIAKESFDSLNFQGKLRLTLGERSNLRLSGRVASWKADDYPDASGGPLFGSGALRRADNQEASFSAELSRNGTSGQFHKVNAAFYRHDLGRTSPAVYLPRGSDGEPLIPVVPASLESTLFTRLRLGWASSWESSLGRRPRQGERTSVVRMSLGADIEREVGENVSLLSLGPQVGDVVGDYSLVRTSRGVYTELVAERGNLTTELGARLDLPDHFSLQVSPRLGLSYRPGTGATRLRASLGRAFKLPSFFALGSPSALGGNPDLRSEVMIGGDVGLEREFAAANVNGALTLFYNRFHDLVDFDFKAFSHVNRLDVKSQGAEFELDFHPAERLTAAANVTYQNVADVSTGKPLRHRPEWVGGVRVEWRPRPGITLHVDGRFVSAAFDEQIPVPDARTTAGYELWGWSGSWRLAQNIELEAHVANLFDEYYETMIGFPGAGRGGRLAVRYVFSGKDSGT